MTTTINASTINGFVTTADTSGQLAIQANGTTVATAQSTGLNIASTGLVFSDSTTQTSGSGVAKAWVNFNGTATSGSATIRAFYNVSSVTINGTGLYTVNFTNAFADANYTTVGGASRYAYGTSSYGSNVHPENISSSQVYLQVGYEDTYSGPIALNSYYVGIAVFR